MAVRPLLLVLTLLAIAVGISGCGLSDADSARRSSWDTPTRITLYSGGRPVKTYLTKGKVLPEDRSDGWYFVDAATGKLVIVTGTMTIERQ